jgi:pimeloyl-ACP methyl ester carboxylesterase
VVTPSLYPRGPSALVGRHPVEKEAADAAALVRGLAAAPRSRVVLAGHSRGGQAAWRAANLLAADDLVDALVLVDPVDGGGRSPQEPTSTTRPAVFTCPALIVGAGLGGRCAPAPVNHEVFAAAAPDARHVVVPELGHADILDGRTRAFGRRLCGGAAEPDPGRAAVSRLLVAFSADHHVPDDGMIRVLR